MVYWYTRYFRNILHPEENQGQKQINFTMGVLLSWPFVIMKLIIEFVLTYGYLDQVTRSLILDGQFEQLFQSFSQASLQSGFLVLFITTFFHMVTFPFWELLNYLLWVAVINLYLWALKIDKDKTANQIVCASLSSHSFSIIPLFGDLAKNFSKVFILFQALRRRLGISALSALLIVLTPMLVWFFMIMAIAVLVVLLLSPIG